MSRLKWCVALATGWLVAGCAGAPEEIAEGGLAADPARTASASTAEPAAATTTSVSTAEPAAPTTSPSTEAVAAAGGAEAPVLAIDAAQLAPSPNEGQVCREVLRPNSNVIVNVCGTPAQWKQYERMEAQNAAAITRMMQGESGSFR